ncbi:LysE family translocator [Roseobacter sp. HKCCA0434]|uniref:LysE family translocator n=1 Tax=Roseobacter sp. HKCCA0434 TaxID=3079297 RepID=UPI002905B6F4|nr:LysE family translocator [Roseobacter sp. HKCCA0434]
MSIAVALCTFLIAAGSPGPATLGVAATAMASGRRRAIRQAIGLAIGLGLWGAAAGAGFATLVLGSPPVLMVVKLVGAAYLGWLALAALRSARRTSPTPARRPGGAFRSGLLLNLLNPKAALAWVAALALGQGGTTAATWTTVVACALLGLVLYLAYAILFSRASVMASYAAARRWIDGACAVFFGAAAIRLAVWRPT